MLSWFRSQPTCPVPSEQKDWIESRFRWLIGEFGMEFLRSVTQILPTTEYFPDHYDGTEEELQSMMETVAQYMRVDPETLRLNLYRERKPRGLPIEHSGTAGLYSEDETHFNIWLEVDTLDDPLGVVATFAHEIGHVILLGQKRISPEEEDHEPLTDLLTVFHGLGIFTANSVIKESYLSTAQYHRWEIGRQGYLTMDMHGYALALFSLLRSEPQPTWFGYLRPDVKSFFKQGVRYITATGDCSLEMPDSCA